MDFDLEKFSGFVPVAIEENISIIVALFVFILIVNIILISSNFIFYTVNEWIILEYSSNASSSIANTAFGRLSKGERLNFTL